MIASDLTIRRFNARRAAPPQPDSPRTLGVRSDTSNPTSPSSISRNPSPRSSRRCPCSNEKWKTTREERICCEYARTKSVENRVDGAVLALLDISATKDALLVARRTADALVHRVPDPILLLDAELKVTGANPAFCTAFALELEQVEGRYVYELGGGQWNIPALRRLLEHVLPERKNFEGFVTEHDFAGLGKRRLLLDGPNRSIGSLRGPRSFYLAIRVQHLLSTEGDRGSVPASDPRLERLHAREERVQMVGCTF